MAAPAIILIRGLPAPDSRGKILPPARRCAATGGTMVYHFAYLIQRKLLRLRSFGFLASRP